MWSISIGKQFSQPMRPRRKDGTIKEHLVKQMCRDRRTVIAPNFLEWPNKYTSIQHCGTHRVVKADYRDVLAEHCADVSVIYADPPYTRDHYSRFYHVLESLCLRDSPSVSATQLNGNGPISRGFYREDRNQSPFCIKSQAVNAFHALFSSVAELRTPMLVSYSPYVRDGHPRLVTVEAIVDLASNFFSEVKVSEVPGLKHSKLNKTVLELNAMEEGEVFITCR